MSDVTNDRIAREWQRVIHPLAKPHLILCMGCDESSIVGSTEQAIRLGWTEVFGKHPRFAVRSAGLCPECSEAVSRSGELMPPARAGGPKDSPKPVRKPMAKTKAASGVKKVSAAKAPKSGGKAPAKKVPAAKKKSAGNKATKG